MTNVDATASVGLTIVRAGAWLADGTTGAGTGVPASGEGAVGAGDQMTGAWWCQGDTRAGTELAQGLLRELNPGPLAPKARIMPLDQAAD